MFVKDLKPGMVLDNQYIFLGLYENSTDEPMIHLVALEDPFYGAVYRTYDTDDDFEVRAVTEDEKLEVIGFFRENINSLIDLSLQVYAL